MMMISQRRLIFNGITIVVYSLSSVVAQEIKKESRYFLPRKGEKKESWVVEVIFLGIVLAVTLFLLVLMLYYHLKKKYGGGDNDHINTHVNKIQEVNSIPFYQSEYNIMKDNAKDDIPMTIVANKTEASPAANHEDPLNDQVMWLQNFRTGKM